MAKKKKQSTNCSLCKGKGFTVPKAPGKEYCHTHEYKERRKDAQSNTTV